MSIAQGIEIPQLRAAPNRRTATAREAADVVCPLERLAGEHVTLLHRRFRPGGLCALGHVVVGRAGVYVVGVEPCSGEPVRTQVVGGMIAPRRTELLVRGRVVNSLVERVDRQANDVLSTLASTGRPEVAVLPALWLVDGSLPALRSSLRIDDIAVVGTYRLRRTLARRGPLDALQRYRLRCLLAERFPGLG